MSTAKAFNELLVWIIKLLFERGCVINGAKHLSSPCVHHLVHHHVRAETEASEMMNVTTQKWNFVQPGNVSRVTRPSDDEFISETIPTLRRHHAISWFVLRHSSVRLYGESRSDHKRCEIPLNGHKQGKRFWWINYGLGWRVSERRRRIHWPWSLTERTKPQQCFILINSLARSMREQVSAINIDCGFWCYTRVKRTLSTLANLVSLNLWLAKVLRLVQCN